MRYSLFAVIVIILSILSITSNSIEESVSACTCSVYDLNGNVVLSSPAVNGQCSISCFTGNQLNPACAAQTVYRVRMDCASQFHSSSYYNCNDGISCVSNSVQRAVPAVSYRGINNAQYISIDYDDNIISTYNSLIIDALACSQVANQDQSDTSLTFLDSNTVPSSTNRCCGDDRLVWDFESGVTNNVYLEGWIKSS